MQGIGFMLKAHTRHLKWVAKVKEDDGKLRPWHYIYVYSIESSQEAAGSNFKSDIDIIILFYKVDSPEKKQLWTYTKNKTRQKWCVFKENQL